MKIKFYETRTTIVHPEKDEKIIIVSVHQARSRFEAIGKAIAKIIPCYTGYFVKGAVAYFTRQQPVH